MKRCFVALDLPEKITEEIVRIQDQLSGADLFKGKFTKKENIHLTLKFLGEIDDQRVARVKRALDDISLEAPTVKLSELGVFDRQHVRIIWVHLAGVDQLQMEVDRALKEAFKPEHRFMSHITIARVKEVKNKARLFSKLRAIQHQIVKVPAPSFSLLQSTLTPKGPVYNRLSRYRLE